MIKMIIVEMTRGKIILLSLRLFLILFYCIKKLPHQESFTKHWDNLPKELRNRNCQKEQKKPFKMLLNYVRRCQVCTYMKKNVLQDDHFFFIRNAFFFLLSHHISQLLILDFFHYHFFILKMLLFYFLRKMVVCKSDFFPFQNSISIFVDGYYNLQLSCRSYVYNNSNFSSIIVWNKSIFKYYEYKVTGTDK